MKSVNLVNILSLLFIAATLQSCATNPNTSNIPNQAYTTTPSIQKQSYMYRSPSGAALQSRGLSR